MEYTNFLVFQMTISFLEEITNLNVKRDYPEGTAVQGAFIVNNKIFMSNTCLCVCICTYKSRFCILDST